MIGRYLGLIEALGSGAIVLGFCAYQYWATSRSIKEDHELAEAARHAEREHELGDG
jgi:hypothetical protein